MPLTQSLSPPDQPIRPHQPEKSTGRVKGGRAGDRTKRRLIIARCTTPKAVTKLCGVRREGERIGGIHLVLCDPPRCMAGDVRAYVCTYVRTYSSIVFFTLFDKDTLFVFCLCLMCTRVFLFFSKIPHRNRCFSQQSNV